jgi:carboxypeptidase PM20D1
LPFGHKEEVLGDGAGRLAEVFKARNINLEFVLDEGSAMTKGLAQGVSRPVAAVGVAEKGYLSLELRVDAKGGHPLIPPRHTAVGILSAAIHRLEDERPPPVLKEPTRQMLAYTGPEMSFGRRLLMANLWLSGGVVGRVLDKTDAGSAIVRTSIAATMFQGSSKENVLPPRATAVVLFRSLPGERNEQVIERARRTINDSRVMIKPIRNWEASPIAHFEGPAGRVLQTTIHQVFPDAVVAPTLFPGITDSRMFVNIAGDVFRFRPFTATPETTRLIHGTNERISIEDCASTVRFNVQLILNADR